MLLEDFQQPCLAPLTGGFMRVNGSTLMTGLSEGPRTSCYLDGAVCLDVSYRTGEFKITHVFGVHELLWNQSMHVHGDNTLQRIFVSYHVFFEIVAVDDGVIGEANPLSCRNACYVETQ